MGLDHEVFASMLLTMNFVVCVLLDIKAPQSIISLFGPIPSAVLIRQLLAGGNQNFNDLEKMHVHELHKP